MADCSKWFPKDFGKDVKTLSKVSVVRIPVVICVCASVAISVNWEKIFAHL